VPTDIYVGTPRSPLRCFVSSELVLEVNNFVACSVDVNSRAQPDAADAGRFFRTSSPSPETSRHRVAQNAPPVRWRARLTRHAFPPDDQAVTPRNRSARPEPPASAIDYAKLTSLGALHMAQYFPAAFTGIALPAIFRAEGLPLEMFWLLALPGIPRWFKWLIALAVDNFGSARFGYRKSWIVPCTFLGAVLYFSLSYLNPSIATVYIIVGILFVKSLIMAAQDIAVDGFASESLTDVDRTVGTSIIIFMAYLGGVIGGGLMSVVETFGWSATMTIAALLLIAAALPAVVRREPAPPIASRERRERGERPNLIKALKRKDSRFILPFVFVFGFGNTFFATLLSVFLVDKGLSLTEIGLILPIATFIGTGSGALLTPVFVKRLGLRGAAVIGLLTLPIEGLVFAWFAASDTLPSFALIIPVLAILNFTTSIYSFAVNNSRFRWSSKAQAATDFSMQSSFWNFGVWAAGTVAGFVAGGLGWTAFFIIVAIVGVVSAGSYVAMFNHVERLVVQREQDEIGSEPNMSPAAS
jgi:predicted MFS family arabinose efflux permease